MHTNGLAATVNQYRLASGGFVYGAGAYSVGACGPLRRT